MPRNDIIINNTKFKHRDIRYRNEKSIIDYVLVNTFETNKICLSSNQVSSNDGTFYIKSNNKRR